MKLKYHVEDSTYSILVTVEELALIHTALEASHQNAVAPCVAIHAMFHALDRAIFPSRQLQELVDHPSVGELATLADLDYLR